MCPTEHNKADDSSGDSPPSSPGATTQDAKVDLSLSTGDGGIRERKISNINAIKTWEPEVDHHPHQTHHDKIEKKVQEKLDDELGHGHGAAEKKIPKVRKSAQYLSALAANFGAFALGTVMAWSATGLPSLRSSGDIGEITLSQESWIGSIVTLAAVFSCPLAAYGMVTFGRKRSMILLNAPFIFGWFCIAFADVLPSFLPPVYTVYFGRALTGLCGGAYSVITPVFIAECSQDNLRGTLASGFDLMLSAGMLFVYVIGSFTSWQTQALVCGFIPIVIHVLLMLVSESPRFLIEMGRITEANAALQWLFGFKDEQLTTEISALTKSVEDSQAKPINFDRVILKMSVLKPILICLGIMFFYTMCVYDAVIFYTVDIFKSTGTSMDPKDCTIILGSVGVIASIPAALIVDKCGRRLLLLLSEALLFISLAALGTFFYITKSDVEPDNTLHVQYGWLPLTALNVFLIGYSIGLGPIALLLVGELVPSHVKGLTTCFALTVRWLLGFAVTNLFETLQSSIGLDVSWWIFSAICALGFVFVFCCVPETKGKSLDDIQIGFISKKKLQQVIMAPIRRISMQFQHHHHNFENNIVMNHNDNTVVPMSIKRVAKPQENE